MRVRLTWQEKEAVRQLYHRQCHRCGTSGKRRNQLTIHHQNHDPGDNRIENLELLCRRCHCAHHEQNG